VHRLPPTAAYHKINCRDNREPSPYIRGRWQIAAQRYPPACWGSSNRGRSSPLFSAKSPHLLPYSLHSMPCSNRASGIPLCIRRAAQRLRRKPRPLRNHGLSSGSFPGRNASWHSVLPAFCGHYYVKSPFHCRRGNQRDPGRDFLLPRLLPPPFGRACAGYMLSALLP